MRLLNLLLGALAGMTAAMIAHGIARAAELEGRTYHHVVGWSVTLYYEPPTPERSHRRVSGYVPKRSQCIDLLRTTFATEVGGRLRCDYTDELMVVAPR